MKRLVTRLGLLLVLGAGACRGIVGVDDKTYSTCVEGPAAECPPGLADCNQCASDGCEVDLQSSETSCGRCDRACSLCGAGICEPEKLVAGILPFVYQLAVDDQFVYYSLEDFKVAALPKTQGKPVVVASGTQELSGITVHQGYLYFLGLYGLLQRKYIDGGQLENLTTTTHWLSNIDVDGSDIYFTSHDDGQTAPPDGFLAKLPKTGGSVVKLHQGESCHALKLDATHVYFSAESGLKKLDKQSGSTPVALTEPGTSAGDPAGIDLDETHVYFATGAGDLYRIEKSGANLQQLSKGNARGGSRVFVDEDRVYWRDQDGSYSTLYAMPKQGSVLPQVMAKPRAYLNGTFVVDDTHVYWLSADEDNLNTLSNTLYRTPK